MDKQSYRSARVLFYRMKWTVCILMSWVIQSTAVKRSFAFSHDVLKTPASVHTGLNGTVEGSLIVGHNAQIDGLTSMTYTRILDTGYQGVAGLLVDKNARVVGDLQVGGEVRLSSGMWIGESGVLVTGQMNTSSEIWSQGTIRAQKDLVVDGDLLVGAGSGDLKVFHLASVRSLQARLDGKQKQSCTDYVFHAFFSLMITLFSCHHVTSNNGGKHALCWDHNFWNVTNGRLASACPPSWNTGEDS